MANNKTQAEIQLIANELFADIRIPLRVCSDNGIIEKVIIKVDDEVYKTMPESQISRIEDIIGYNMSLHGFCLNGFNDVRVYDNLPNKTCLVFGINDATIRQIRLGRY
jgi:hypothetical protein